MPKGYEILGATTVATRNLTFYGQVGNNRFPDVLLSSCGFASQIIQPVRVCLHHPRASFEILRFVVA